MGLWMDKDSGVFMLNGKKMIKGLQNHPSPIEVIGDYVVESVCTIEVQVLNQWFLAINDPLKYASLWAESDFSLSEKMGKVMGAVAMEAKAMSEADNSGKADKLGKTLLLNTEPDTLFPLHQTLRMNDPSWEERTLLQEAAEMRRKDAEEQRNKDTEEQRKRKEEFNSKTKSDAKMATTAPAGKKT
ncbi:hypothetical protein ZIOFF_068706 [Zingiber officinale]|uniref:Uncharacterized protein n=1 Tax=Zingiber officinale TaxID=94328 RepID=A0A8J5ES15_ZINOF|nr:hypothetical protein ZIOFF_068706 [Zingiber officinale]